MNIYSNEIKIPGEIVGPAIAATIDRRALTPSFDAFRFKDEYDPLKLRTILSLAFREWGL